jgi:ketosteroid isomerase-like protein
MTSLETAQHYFTLSNEGDLNAIGLLITPDAIYSSDTTGLYYGREDIMAMMQEFFVRFDSLHWTIDTINEIKPEIIEIHFHAVFQNRESTIEKAGIERIIVRNNLIQYIEVRNS